MEHDMIGLRGQITTNHQPFDLSDRCFFRHFKLISIISSHIIINMNEEETIDQSDNNRISSCFSSILAIPHTWQFQPNYYFFFFVKHFYVGKHWNFIMNCSVDFWQFKKSFANEWIEFEQKFKYLNGNLKESLENVLKNYFERGLIH